MVLNKRGQLILVSIMIAFVAMMFIIVLIEPIKEGVTIGRNDLDCTNTTLSTGDEMSCIVMDMYLPMWIGVGLAVVIGYFGIKRLTEENQQ